MELRHLRYFIAVAEAGSFSHAAKRLHIAQPPLSQQIAALEQEMEVQLFHRTSRGVSLTRAGEAFLNEANLTLAQSRRAVQTAQRADRGETGHLEIGFITSTTTPAFSRIIRQFRATHAHVTLALHDLCESDMIKRIRTGSLDVGFMRHAPEDPGLESTEIWRDALSVGMTADHPLAAKRHVRMSDIAREPFVMLSPDRYSRANHCVHALCNEHGFIAQVAQHANDYQSLLWLVSVGIGITIAADSLQHFHRDGMVWRHFKGVTATSPMLMIQRRNGASPALNLFRQSVLAETQAKRSCSPLGQAK
jgi:DNA-binding transcriptional LysR family regulator